MSIQKLIERLLAEASDSSSVRITPRSTASDTDLAAWEQKHGFQLQPDYRLFQREIGECYLHVIPGDGTHTCSIRLMPLSEVDRYRWVVCTDKFDEISDTLYAFADHHDNN